MPYLYNHWHLAVNLPANMKFYKGPNDLYFGFAADERLHLLHSGAKVSKAQLIFLFKTLYNIKSADFYCDYPERAMCFMSATSDKRQLLIFVSDSRQYK